MKEMTIMEASRQLGARSISPVELATSCLATIDALNPSVAAFITVTADRALADARASEDRMMRGNRRSPLALLWQIDASLI